MAKKTLTPAQKNFLEVTKEAKKLWATGKYKKYSEATKKAWANKK